jgi:hypothetical protein
MNKVSKCNGGCNYRIQHMNKARLERLGLLPQSLLVTDTAIAWHGNYGGTDNNDEDEQPKC